jgi:hypothetical protein
MHCYDSQMAAGNSQLDRFASLFGSADLPVFRVGKSPPSLYVTITNPTKAGTGKQQFPGAGNLP